MRKLLLTLSIFSVVILAGCSDRVDTSKPVKKESTEIKNENIENIDNLTLEKGNSSTLEDAIENDDKKAIVYLLKHEKADPNQKTKNGEPLLNIAARRGFAFAVEQLLKAGANVNAVDTDGNTALINLYQEDYYFSKLEGITNYTEVRDLLLNAGADVNIVAKDGWSANKTALRGASYVGNVDDVEKLLKAGADVNATANDNETALIWACMGMDSVGDNDEKYKNEIVRLLLAAGANQKEEAWETAVDSNFPKIAKTIWDSGINIEGKAGEELLLTASNAGMLETVKILLESGVNANTVDKNKKSALAYAVSPCGVGICDDKDAVAKALIAAGADVNLISKEGQTPLLYATYTGNTEMVEFLLKSGADVNIKFDGETLLQRVQKEEYEEYTEIVKLLKAAGAKE